MRECFIVAAGDEGQGNQPLSLQGLSFPVS